jgi:hypothetical protein
MADTRPPRGDFPGAFHHVTNRGLANRPAFEGREDVRAFLCLLAWEVHAGRLEVHAFSILTTHFHLLLRSVKGELSDSMMRIEYRYVKRFNRLRGRDGSLFRSRFRSRIVDSDEYWFNVIRYIDANAVDAGLCARSVEYEFGSARMHAAARSAPWLERSEVQGTVQRLCRRWRVASPDYERVFGVVLDSDERWIIERRIEEGGPNCGGAEAGNELLRAAPAHVLRWLRSRAELADGGRVGLTLTAPGVVRRVVDLESKLEPEWTCGRGRKRKPGWPVIEAGLLRQFCGLTLQEIADLVGVSRSGAWLRCAAHDEWLGSEAGYAERMERVVRAVQEGKELANSGKP